jgi:pyruvate dehydrogenase E2 component (dihydrolipoamide acetyltransferase)
VSLAQAPQANPGRRFASPLSRVLARHAGLDLATLRGSGPLGRIVKADVAAALAAMAPQQARPLPETEGGPAFDEIPNSLGRRLLARKLTESKREAPHFYIRVDCEMDAVLGQRAAHQAQAECEGLKLSINDFVIQAAARALNEIAAVNVSYTEAAIRRYRHVDIAVAVAVDDGLLAPVLRDADRKSVAQIAREVAALAARARAGTLEPGACRGAGFSISNLGGFGVREFAAVLNPPQGAILAVGAAEPRAVVRDGKLAVATMLTVDHRAIDGALAAQWLACFRRHLENPRERDIWSSPLHAP